MRDEMLKRLMGKWRGGIVKFLDLAVIHRLYQGIIFFSLPFCLETFLLSLSLCEAVEKSKTREKKSQDKNKGGRRARKLLRFQ